MSGEREIMTWDGFGAASRELAEMVANSGYEPDIILAIARGGLAPLAEVDLANPETIFGVSPAECLWRDGRWVRAAR